MTQKERERERVEAPTESHQGFVIIFQQTVKELTKHSVFFHLCQTNGFCPVIALEKGANQQHLDCHRP